MPTDPDVVSRTGPGRSDLDVALAVAAGGAIGGGARFALSWAWPHVGAGFPWATFAANVSGSLMLGVLMVFVADVWRPRRYARPFLGVGVLGGFTTFSTFATETDALIRQGAFGMALVYVGATVALGLCATALGMILTRKAVGVG
ncbi:MAG: CrcB family protein [Actinobacteria bacterium]|nr:CrcB family protein [Actinomycetota bacterium]MCB9411848.1 CrcB family protein [Actinomycetota bacterium]